MSKRVTRQLRSERSQSIVEFSLIAPILLLLIFGVVDFGRGLYYYISLQQAANEGARVAVRDSQYTDIGGTSHTYPTSVDVQNAVTAHAPSVFLSTQCPFGPINASYVPPANQGWIYITDASAGGTGTPNGPLGDSLPPPGQTTGSQLYGGGTVNGEACNAETPANANAALKVTIRYNFVPLTPLIQQVTANKIVLTAYAIYRTEY